MRRSPGFPRPANTTTHRASLRAGDRVGNPGPTAGTRRYAVAASVRWWWGDEEGGRRLPAGEVHAWEPGANQTVCGLSPHRSRLTRFAGVSWSDVQPESGGAADAVRRVCPRCTAAATRRAPGTRRNWHRIDPRP